MRHKANRAERAFMDALFDDGPVKVAVDLDPGTASALGIDGSDPAMLDSLEGSAAAVPSVEEGPSEQDFGETDQADLPPEQPPVEDGEVVEEEPPPPPGRAEYGRLFSRKMGNALQIFDVLNAKYKGDWTQWEPETLWWALRRDFGPVGELARHKVMALRVAAITDITWLDWDIFEDSGLAWNDTIPIFGAYQPMDPMQVAFAVSILREIRGDEGFDNEVTAYISAILDDHGFVFAPAPYFGDAQRLLDRKADSHELRDHVAQMWEKLKDTDPLTVDFSGESPVDVHMLKLFTVKAYLDARAASRGDIAAAGAGSTTVSPPVP